MTFRQMIMNELTSNGMFESQALQVMEMVKEESPEMAHYWDDDTAEFPPPLVAVLLMSARRNALAWIDKNLPRAFYRPMFVD